jgi:hypothetical protein
MPQNERIGVWKGELEKTSGGLRKKDLIKNKRGKIVSKSKSEAAKKNAQNNLGAWLRSKGDHFLSKGLKQENIVRKGKPGRKAFKQKEEYIKAVAPKKKKKVAAAPKKKKGPPKITKSEPAKPGEKPKDRTKIHVGNIITEEVKIYAMNVKLLRKELKFTKKQIIEEMGKAPEGYKWTF